MKNEVITVAEQNKKCNLFQKAVYGASALAATASMTGTSALAVSIKKANIKADAGNNTDDIIGSVIGMVLLISKYVGIALIIYGVYEVVMSFLQNQPEAKTKGVIMALAGAIMVGLEGILNAMGILS